MAKSEINLQESSTGKLVARFDDTNKKTQSFSIHNPRFAGNVPTVNLPSSAEQVYPQKIMVGQAKNHISDLHFDEFLTPSSFPGWWTRFKNRSANNALDFRSRDGYF